jgi:hypothetical protein
MINYFDIFYDAISQYYIHYKIFSRLVISITFYVII